MTKISEDEPNNNYLLENNIADLPPIGLGTMGYGGYFKRNESNFDHCLGLLAHAYEQGIRVIDTAEVYGEGSAEEIIGSLPASVRSNLFIMSKFSPENSNPKDIRIALDRTLKRLGRPFVDVYQPHWPSTEIGLPEILDELIKQKDLGKIRYIGVSNYSPKALESLPKDLRAEIKFIQSEFNPIESSALNQFKPVIEANDGYLVAYSPFRDGEIFRVYGADRLQELAVNTGCTPAQLILLWVIRSGKVLAIPKSMSLERINENAQTTNKSLSDKDFALISEIFKVKTAKIPVNMIIQESEQGSDRKTYLTLQEAIANRFGLYPGPIEIAEEIAANNGELSKPVKVRLLPDGRYTLVEGRLRYWAWRILHKDAEPIPSVIVE